MKLADSLTLDKAGWKHPHTMRPVGLPHQSDDTRAWQTTTMRVRPSPPAIRGHGQSAVSAGVPLLEAAGGADSGSEQLRQLEVGAGDSIPGDGSQLR